MAELELGDKENFGERWYSIRIANERLDQESTKHYQRIARSILLLFSGYPVQALSEALADSKYTLASFTDTKFRDGKDGKREHAHGLSYSIHDDKFKVENAVDFDRQREYRLLKRVSGDTPIVSVETYESQAELDKAIELKVTTDQFKELILKKWLAKTDDFLKGLINKLQSENNPTDS